MGFWDIGAGDLLGGALSLGGSLFGAASSASGVASMNAANAGIAQANRDWMTQMSNTAHTREVADLKNAGLNPILSATGGNGAAVPGSAMIPMQNTNAQSSGIIAEAMKGINLKSLSEAKLNNAAADTEKTKQVLNVANAKAAGGFVGVPGFARVPLDRVASGLWSLIAPTSARQSELKSQGVKTWFN